MRTSPAAVSLRLAPLALLLTAATSCGGEAPQQVDWRNRSLAWKYGPTTGAASLVHLEGTGAKGRALAEGWKVRIADGARLVVEPVRLAAKHELFDEVTLAVALYDQDSKEIETFVSPPIAKDAAPITFELSEATAKKTYDAILWFRPAKG